MASLKPAVILNPHSQGGKTGQQATELVRVMTRYLGPVDVLHTEAPRHAVELAEQAARDGRPSVIAVGGDGTISEIANGLLRARGAVATLPKLGIVGQGTGGDFRKTLGIEHRLDQYLQTIARGVTRTVDAGKFSYRNHAGDTAEAYFVNILSMGMGGLVDMYVAEARSQSQMSGTLAYFSASVKALTKSEVGVLELTIDDQPPRELATRQLAICNGRFFGSGMEVAPMAVLDDGLFHCISLGAAPRLKFALGSLAIYSGKHVDKPEVEVWSCRKIGIELRNVDVRDVFPLDVDGEPLGTLPLSVELIDKALEVYAAG
jgi:diacylglycerol kinase (ATP)